MSYPIDALFTLGPNQSEYLPRHTDYQESWHSVSSSLTVHESLTRVQIQELAGWGVATRVFSNWFWRCLQKGYLVPVGQHSYADAVADALPTSDTIDGPEAEKYTVLSADELLSCWSLTRAYLKELPNREDLCLEHITERFAEHISLLRRLECRIELLQSREQS